MPLILPIGLADYINSGTLNPKSPSYTDSFIEQAAEMEAVQDEMIGRQYHLGLSSDHNLTPGVYFLLKINLGMKTQETQKQSFKINNFIF